MTRTSSRLANDAWEALLTAHAALIKHLAADRIWHEVTMREYDVLYTLSKCDRPTRIGELNRNVLLSQPALSRLVERLAERGLIERSADPADGRGVRLSLTEAGRLQQRRVGGRHAVGVARAVAAELSEEEMRQLEAICRKLSGADRAAGPDRNDTATSEPEEVTT
ncbi:MarR family winged helix-turn-helix transcriptional regulator [Glycomyces xiaoerkulensis]|uniref:MarR family winged helix-turn-helix transcriptional regulator n=1 Tax=Glycomyces xiaoerkulensis TaxID=2038139 RepID=UPI000C25616C|nr:MarR family transcriptional regulator [Glycomyces xiaoerkulensis]